MTKVKVNLWGAFREKAGGIKTPEIEHVDGMTLRSLIHEIGKKYGDGLEWMILDKKNDGSLKPYVIILVDGRAGMPLSTKIGNDDVIQIFPPVSGG